MRIPVDSADVAELREAERAQAEAEVSERERHVRECRDGWRGEDSEGRPVPCTQCRPHLLHMPCATCGAAWNACQAQVQARRGGCCDSCLHLHRAGDVGGR